MKPDTGSLVRALVYGVALIYLFIDLFVLKGPLYRRVKDSNPASEKAIAEETARGVAARVFYQPILLTQIDRTIEERFYLRGKEAHGLEGEALRLERLIALNEIFEEHLLRIKVRFNASEFEVSEEEVATAVKVFKKRFASEQLLKEAIAIQGWKGEEELVARVRAKLEQEAYLKKYVQVEVSEQELTNYFEEYGGRFGIPERIKVRHIFLADLEHPAGEAHRLAELMREDLSQGKSFVELAAARSEDPATKNRGGELGWMARNRLPKEFGEELFAIPVGELQIVDSKIGTHLVEILEKKPARARSFEEVKEELREALSNQRRDEGVKEYLRVLHHRESNKLEIFAEVLDRPWSL